MKGIFKIYHPEETLKYHIAQTYCKAVYSNSQHLLEIEIVTDDSLDHVDDDSLQYQFPQICLTVTDFPVDDDDLEGKTFSLEEKDETYTEVDLYDDEDAYLSDNRLTFGRNAAGDLELCWSGLITDFFSASEEKIPFKLKCDFRADAIDVADE